MKKILMFSHEYPPIGGGAGVVAQQNAIKLAELGYDVTLLTNCNSSSEWNKVSFRVVELEKPGKLWFLRYRNIIDFSEFDLILLNDPAAIFVSGLFFSRQVLKKCVPFLHGSEPEKIFKKPKLSFRILQFSFFYVRSLRYSHRIIAVSEFMKSKFLSKTGLHDLDNKIVVNYAGIDLGLFRPSSSFSLKQDLGIPLESELLLSVSRIVMEKGFPAMLDVFSELVSDDDSFYWAVIGTGEYVPELKNELLKRNLQSKVFILGGVDRSDLNFYYSNADVFWLLSEFEESFGLVFLEAQACGTPVIGLNHSGIKEAVGPECGFLVDDPNSALYILAEKRYLNINRFDVISYARKFSLSNTIPRLIDICF